MISKQDRQNNQVVFLKDFILCNNLENLFLSNQDIVDVENWVLFEGLKKIFLDANNII